MFDSSSKLKEKQKSKGALLGLRQLFSTESPLRMMKKGFYFTLKVLVVLKILYLDFCLEF